MKFSFNLYLSVLMIPDIVQASIPTGLVARGGFQVPTFVVSNHGLLCLVWLAHFWRTMALPNSLGLNIFLSLSVFL